MRHYSLRTEQAYVDWARRYIRFHGLRHPQELGPAEVAAFLTHLAVQREVSASTQAQARSALLFLYRQVLGVDLPWLQEAVVAKPARRLPVVLTPGEVRALLAELSGTMGLVAGLLYGTGMRLMEALRLRVKDVAFERRELVMRHGKGGKDRVTVLPETLVAPMQAHLSRVQALHGRDLAEGHGAVWLPDALALKYWQAPRAWGWQWVFRIRASCWPEGADAQGCDAKRGHRPPAPVRRHRQFQPACRGPGAGARPQAAGRGTARRWRPCGRRAQRRARRGPSHNARPATATSGNTPHCTRATKASFSRSAPE